MRLGFFTPLYMPDVGGAEILLDRLIRTLLARGHHVALVAPAPRHCPGTPPPLPYPVIRTLRPFSKRCRLHFLPPLLFAHWRHRFDVIHCQDEFFAPPVARLFMRLTGVPYVVRAVGGGFDTLGNRPDLAGPVRRGLAGAASCIAQGEFLHGQFIQYGVEPRRIATIHNGVAPEEVCVDGPAPRPPPYILYTGGLKRIKGYDLLLRAWARIRAAAAPVRLVIAGRDDELAHYRQLCAELQLQEGRDVEYAGTLGRREVALHLRHALFYVGPFRRAAFANANLEAMMAGLPLVVTAVDGNLQQVRDGVEGLLVPPDDPAALADAMLRFCRDAELRSRCAAAAAARARREFTWEAMVDRYEALYASVANRPGEGR